MKMRSLFALNVYLRAFVTDYSEFFQRSTLTTHERFQGTYSKRLRWITE